MNNKFSENLKKIRKDNNMSQEQLAYELGVSRQAISKWESNSAYPEMDKIIALCDKFNLNIDDLLHKDIREVKGEEESKKKLNEYINDFLNFITNSINMFSNMSFKSKLKCLLEQIIIIVMLCFLWVLIGEFGQHFMSSFIEVLPTKIYYVLNSIISLIYGLFAILSSIIIMVHIYKTRYLDYYEKIKNETLNNNDSVLINEKINDNQIDEENKMIFQKNEEKIIIRDPKHSEYRFINGIGRGIVKIIKCLALLLSLFLFILLICLFFSFAVSFLIIKTGIFFWGLIIMILAISIIVIIFILLILNFVFNRKNDKKKMIWIFITSLIMIGIGSGLIFIGALNFEYIEKDNTVLETNVMEFDMSDELFFDTYYNKEYIESNINNVKIEYSINSYYELNSYTSLNYSPIYLVTNCKDPIKIANYFINNLNNKKLISINDGFETLKIYANKENIEIIKENEYNFYNLQEQNDFIVESYQNTISDMQEQIDNYIEQINDLKEQLYIYENNEEQ